MIEGLNALINEAIKNGAMPGANYALINNGQKYFGSFGNKALYPAVEANDIDTLYDMASLSKVVSTTTCLMLLMERGKLRLYDHVCTYIPEFKHCDITIWDLMTHSSGLPADIPHSLYHNDQELISCIFNTDLKYPKNTKIVYSDIGFILLGWVVEKISGQSLDQFAYENVFKPLEMIDTGYNPKDVKRCAPTEDRGGYIDRGYVHDEKAHALHGVAGHAGLFSTVKDVSHFMEMILNDGVYKNKKFLSKATIDLLYTVQVEEPNGVSKCLNRRGLGWIIKGEAPSSGDFVSPNTIMHTGFTGTNIFIDRDNKVAFCLLANRVHPTRANTLIISFRAKLGNYIMSNR